MSATALPEIIAHRGNAADFPENTLQALESAVMLGLRHIEFDVQLTADKVPVVFHDDDLARVADRPGNIHDLTWAELAEISVGEVTRFGRRYAYTYPASLSQAVEAIAGWEGVTAFVEIKRSSLRKFGRETVLRRVSEVVRPILDRCVFISFDLASLKILRIMTGARIGWVLPNYTDATRQEATEAAPEFLICNLERVPEATEQLWPGAWQWAIYEVRDLQTAQYCRKLGAHFVETMAVQDLLSAFAAHRGGW
jgi:glycerophosphoryl diester phosphodiesterase